MAERNRPSQEGRALGENIARFADVEEDKWRKELGYVPVRCKSCAYRKGSYPNSCLSTVADAMKCTMERIPFFCHHDVKLKQSGKQQPHTICGGWILLYSNEPPVKAPWPFTGTQPSNRTTALPAAL